MKKRKKVARKKSFPKRRKGGRSPSGKKKDSKVRKLIKLARLRARKKK